MGKRFGGAGQTPLRLDQAYDARGQVTSQARYADLAGSTLVGSTLAAYDGARRVTALRHQDGSGGALAYFTYTYDLAGRVQSEAALGGVTTFVYDATGQLTAAAGAAYAYDANGNRTTAGYATGADNRLGADGTWTYTYDAAGQRTKKSQGAGAETWTYGYDERGQLLWAERRATDGGTLLLRADYAYDASGNRIQQAVWTAAAGTVTERYALDPAPDATPETPLAGNENWSVWADLTGSNGLTARYLRGSGVDELWAKVSATQAGRWYLADRLGSVRAVADAAGAAVLQRDYDGFGTVVAETGTGGDRWGWTGREADAATGLRYNRGRYYDAAAGRWLTPDPIGFGAGDANLYRYVRNDAANATDPSGLEKSWAKKYLGIDGDDVRAGVDFVKERVENAAQYPAALKEYVDASSDERKLDAKVQAMQQRERDRADAKRDLVAEVNQWPTDGSGGPLRTGDIPTLTTGLTQLQAAEYVGPAISTLVHSAVAPGKMAPGPIGVAFNLVDAGLYAAEGDYYHAAWGLVGVVGSFNPCHYGTYVGWAIRGASLANAAFHIDSAIRNYQKGHYGAAALDLVGASFSVMNALAACFAAGTRLRVPGGSKPIEDFGIGDTILARDENDPDGPVEEKVVEAVFERTGRVWHLHLEGEVIRTTAEHPFYVEGKGWTSTAQLQPGDRLATDSHVWAAVEQVYDTG